MAVDFLGTNIPRWDIADINYSPLPVTFDNAFMEKWNSKPKVMDDIDSKKLPGEIERLSNIYYRVLDNLPVTDHEYKVLMNTLKRASQLPMPTGKPKLPDKIIIEN
jgi:hypothetical protein